MPGGILFSSKKWMVTFLPDSYDCKSYETYNRRRMNTLENAAKAIATTATERVTTIRTVKTDRT